MVPDLLHSAKVTLGRLEVLHPRGLLGVEAAEVQLDVALALGVVDDLQHHGLVGLAVDPVLRPAVVAHLNAETKLER